MFEKIMPGFGVWMSHVEDGDMRRYDEAGEPEKYQQFLDNRRQFLDKIGVEAKDGFYLKTNLLPDRLNCFDVVDCASRGKGMFDALRETDRRDGVVTRCDSLFLTVSPGDCPIAVIYCPEKRAIMISHLGRANLERGGAFESIRFMKTVIGSSPKFYQVIVTPGAGKEDYPVHALGGAGMQEIIRDQLYTAGVEYENIFISDVNTVRDLRYYSHSRYMTQAKAGQSDLVNGRNIVVARLL